MFERIVSHDPRFKGIIHPTPTTVAVILNDDEDGQVTLTSDEYIDLHHIGPHEMLYATVDIALDDIKGKNIVPTSDMVDVLLDLRGLVTRYADEQRTMFSSLLAFATRVTNDR